MFHQRLTGAVSGVLREEPPTKNLYSPGSSSQSSFCSLNMERNFGSSFTVTVLASPGARRTFSQPASRLGGSFASAGRPTYTCAISARARSPVLRTVKGDAVDAGLQRGVG